MEIKFTKHAEEQMKERGISEDEVINTIKYPEKKFTEWVRVKHMNRGGRLG